LTLKTLQKSFFHGAFLRCWWCISNVRLRKTKILVQPKN